MKLIQSDIFNFNVDEIEIYWTFSNYKELLKWLNGSNSDFMIFEDFTLSKQENLRDYEYKIDFIKDSLKCYGFYVWKAINNKIKTRNYFVVYWGWLKLIPLNEIIDFIDTYIELDEIDVAKWNKHNTMKRFDLAIDIKKDIASIIKNFHNLEQKWAKYFWSKWELETYYIWEYKKRDNRRLLIRIYDKIKDIKQKNKQAIYWEYLSEDNITRIEIEFRTELLRYLKIHQLLDRSYIFNLFTSYINKHTNIFDKIKDDNITKLKYLNKKIDLEELSHNQVLKERYIRSFLWYSKNILEIWSCPVDILFQEWIISQTTKQDIEWWMKKWVFDTNLYRDSVSKRYIKQIFAERNEILTSNYYNHGKV